MKSYPTIATSLRLIPRIKCFAFYKFDGSNLRWEWSRKRGWHKQGTRKRLFDRTDPVFGEAIEIFQRKYAAQLIKVFRKFEARSFTVYTEFFGKNSFAGQHIKEPHDLVLFDVWMHKQGFFPPKIFIKQFGHLDIAPLVHQGNINEQFIIAVQHNILPDYNLEEGVVCKGGPGPYYLLGKIKTLEWLRKLRKKYPETWESLQ